jgi:D-arabinitol dehydrogenase (NADP+)
VQHTQVRYIPDHNFTLNS